MTMANAAMLLPTGALHTNCRTGYDRAYQLSVHGYGSYYVDQVSVSRTAHLLLSESWASSVCMCYWRSYMRCTTTGRQAAGSRFGLGWAVQGTAR